MGQGRRGHPVRGRITYEACQVGPEQISLAHDLDGAVVQQIQLKVRAQEILV